MTSIDRYWRWLITGLAQNYQHCIAERFRPQPFPFKCSMFVQMLLITLIQPKPHDHPQARRLVGWIKPKATISWIHGQN